METYLEGKSGAHGELVFNEKKPTGCLLRACSGQHPMGLPFLAYSPCCFQEYVQ